MALKEEQIHAAADNIAERGESPTLAAVRKELGGGSFTTISEAMKSWRASRNQRQPPTPEIPETIAVEVHRIADELARILWESAQGQARSQIQAERQALEETRAQMENEMKEAAEMADGLAADLEETQKILAQEKISRKDIEETAADLRSQVASLTSERNLLHGQNAGLEEKLEQAQRDMEKARGESATYKGQLESEKERRVAAETELEQAQKALDKARDESATYKGQLESEKERRVAAETEQHEAEKEARAAQERAAVAEEKAREAQEREKESEQARRSAEQSTTEHREKAAAALMKAEENQKQAQAASADAKEARDTAKQLQAALAKSLEEKGKAEQRAALAEQKAADLAERLKEKTVLPGRK